MRKELIRVTGGEKNKEKIECVKKKSHKFKIIIYNLHIFFFSRKLIGFHFLKNNVGCTCEFSSLKESV